jgi:hypothetical protein
MAMPTLSVKSIAASCLDRTAPLSVRRHVFGYIHGPIDRTLSLRSHLELIRGTAFNLSIFLVGHDPGYSGWFTQDEARQVQHAIDVMRELYAQVGLGVRMLYWRYIPTDQACVFVPEDSYCFWDVDRSEATLLTEKFSGPNDGIDVFFVKLVTDAGGWSKTDGSCDKDLQDERTGAVLELKNSDWFTGVLLAHEVGHYLGLPHSGDITNVMGDDSDGDGIGSINSGSINLTSSQGDTMKSHCSVQPPC